MHKVFMLGAALALVSGVAAAQTTVPGQPPELTPPVQTAPPELTPPAQTTPLPPPSTAPTVSPDIPGDVPSAVEDTDEDDADRDRRRGDRERYGRDGDRDRRDGDEDDDRRGDRHHARMQRMHGEMMDRGRWGDRRDFGRRGMASRGAEFRFDRGDGGSIHIRCAEEDSTEECAEAVGPLLQLLLQHPGSSAAPAPGSTPSMPAP